MIAMKVQALITENFTVTVGEETVYLGYDIKEAQNVYDAVHNTFRYTEVADHGSLPCVKLHRRYTADIVLEGTNHIATFGEKELRSNDADFDAPYEDDDGTV